MKALLSVIPIGLVAFLACKPGPGSSCDPREARCLDAKRAIICDDGKFLETPCKGKAGCSTIQESTTCDFSGNQPGDACAKADDIETFGFHLLGLRINGQRERRRE